MFKGNWQIITGLFKRLGLPRADAVPQPRSSSRALTQVVPPELMNFVPLEVNPANPAATAPMRITPARLTGASLESAWKKQTKF